MGHALAALRDVAGVHGSFVLSLTGELVGKDLPAVFHDELFVEVGGRLARLVEGLTGPEISERTGLTPGSVRVNLHRGMERLRRSLAWEATS